MAKEVLASGSASGRSPFASLVRFLEDGVRHVVTVIPKSSGKGAGLVTANANRPNSLARAFEWLNERHFVTCIGGRTMVANIGEPLTFSSFPDFKNRYLNWQIEIGSDDEGKTTRVYPATIWLSHKHRRQHDKIVLDPSAAPDPDVYNLWRGFGVEPIPGKWPRIDWHLEHVICDGNRQTYEWLIRWYAHCVQRPEKQAETAVVMRGLKGTGKGLAAQILCKLFGIHSLQVSNPKHFIGNFNAHLMDKMALFVDEGFWAGDKQNEGLLKTYITEDKLIIEPKGKDAFPMPNRLKIMIASNAEWAVPATWDERRFFVLDVSGCKKGDIAYFKALAKAISGEEVPAFLDDLLKMDLSEFDHRNPPHTVGLNKQKLESLPSVERFWFDCLSSGAIPVKESGEWPDEDWPDVIGTQALHKAYVEHAQQHGHKRPQLDALMAKSLARLVPGGKLERTRPTMSGQRVSQYIIPPLDECRVAFLAAMKIGEHEWPD